MTRNQSLPLMLLTVCLLTCISMPSAVWGQGSIVEVETRQCSGQTCTIGTANGVVVDEWGSVTIIATNAHTVRGQQQVTIKVNCHPVRSDVMAANEKTDVALLRVEGHQERLHPVKLYRGGIAVKSRITISGYWPQMRRWRSTHHEFLQAGWVSGGVQRGVSGAAVMYQGKVIGIVVGTTGMATTYASSSDILALLAQIKPQARPVIETPQPSPEPPASDGAGHRQCCCDCDEFRCQCGPKWSKHSQINLTQSQRIDVLEAKLEALQAELRAIELTPGPQGPPGQDGKDGTVTVNIMEDGKKLHTLKSLTDGTEVDVPVKRIKESQ